MKNDLDNMNQEQLEELVLSLSEGEIISLARDLNKDSFKKLLQHMSHETMRGILNVIGINRIRSFLNQIIKLAMIPFFISLFEYLRDDDFEYWMDFMTTTDLGNLLIMMHERNYMFAKSSEEQKVKHWPWSGHIEIKIDPDQWNEFCEQLIKDTPEEKK